MYEALLNVSGKIVKCAVFCRCSCRIFISFGFLTCRATMWTHSRTFGMNSSSWRWVCSIPRNAGSGQSLIAWLAWLLIFSVSAETYVFLEIPEEPQGWRDSDAKSSWILQCPLLKSKKPNFFSAVLLLRSSFSVWIFYHPISRTLHLFVLRQSALQNAVQQSIERLDLANNSELSFFNALLVSLNSWSINQSINQLTIQSAVW